MNDPAFEALIAAAIDELPREFREALNNIEVVIEARPGPRHRDMFERRKRRWTLLGLYEGVPLAERGTGYAAVLPDKITLFKESIAEQCGGDREAALREIRRTFLHELGHYFGLSDKRLRELGY